MGQRKRASGVEMADVPRHVVVEESSGEYLRRGDYSTLRRGEDLDVVKHVLICSNKVRGQGGDLVLAD